MGVRWFLVLPLLGLLAACGGSSHHVVQPATSPTPAGATTISWSFWGDPQERSINERIVQLFEAEHPEIHVDARWAAYGDYVSRINQWTADGDPPDVAFLSDVPPYAESGYAADLAPFINADHYDLNDFYPQILDTFRYHGDLYGLPRDNDTKVIFYNKDLFDAAHLPYPQEGWTWEDLRRDALALSGAGGSPPYGFAYEPDTWWKLWVWQNGGTIYDNAATPTRLTLDSPAALGALQFLHDLIYVDHVTPPYASLTSSEQIGQLFVAGKLAMAFGNHALVPLFAGTPGLHWAAAPLPRSVQAVNYAGGAGYVIAAHSQHPQQAWTFLKWLLSTKGEAIFTESGLIVPSRRSVGSSNLFLQQGVPAGTRAASPGAGDGPGGLSPEVGRVFIGETERGRGDAQFHGYLAVFDAVNHGLTPIFADGADPRTVVNDLTPRINAMLGGR
jgi:multiple sugar transport system substrate-binding protein